MRNLIRSAVLALGLLPGFAHAQSNSFPQTLPPNTVVGRLGVSAGPTQAIPFINFVTNLPLASGKILIGSAGNFATPQALSGDSTLSILGVMVNTGASGNFTIAGTSAFTGGATFGSPAGGNKGAGTINITGDFYKNGGIIPESVLPPLTISAFGVVACPTCVLISGTAHGDSAYNIASTDRYVYTNAAFTAPRTWNLPAASSLAIGTTIWVQDAQGTVTTTNTLTISRAGADTIDVSNTSLVITGAGGGITFTTDGVSNWGTPIQTASTGGTGQKTLTNHGVLVGAGTSPITQLAVATTGQLLFGVTGADPAFSSTGTGIQAALGVNVGSTGAPVLFNGAGGTPTSLVLTNATSLPTTALTGALQAAQEPAHTGDVTNTAGSLAMTLTTGNAGNLNSGTLLAARMPALTGDCTTTVGTVATTCAKPPYLQAYLSANQSVTDASPTLVNLDTIVTDTGGWFNTTTHLYTPLKAGSYLVTAKVRCAVATNLTACTANVRKNSTDFARASILPGTTATTDAMVTAIVAMNGSTDTISINATAVGTGGSDIFTGGTGPELTYLTIMYVAP